MTNAERRKPDPEAGERDKNAENTGKIGWHLETKKPQKKRSGKTAAGRKSVWKNFPTGVNKITTEFPKKLIENLA